jgi:hypothetical protein
MNEINSKLDGLSELVTRIDAKILDINTKLDELIKALHDYDDENNLHCEYSGLPSVKVYDNEKDILSWDVDGAERRMDIIGQNGNEGIHYVTNEEADDDARSNNTQTKHVGEKKRNKRYYKPKAK